MKTKTIRISFWKLLMVPALLLTSCQQVSTPQNTAAADKIHKALANMSGNLSKSLRVRGAKSTNSSSARGIIDSSGYSGWGPASWNPWGGVPYDDGYYLRSDTDRSIAQCIALVRAVPVAAEYYDFMVATFARCLNTALVYRNPLMTLGYRNSYQGDQYYWRYGLDAGRPGSLGYYTGDYGQYQGYAGTGWTARDIKF